MIAMIPARMGSTRLRMKNLALIKGKPLIYYAIKAAKEAGIFSRIVINSENSLFSQIAKRYNVDFYKRRPELATSRAKSDCVVYDFLKDNPCEILVWVNSIAPLQTGGDIRQAVDFFVRKKLDSLITVKNEFVHCVYKNRPVNFERNAKFARTQDLLPVQPFVYSVMMWRKSVFMQSFKNKGYAILCGRAGFYPVSRLSSVIVKRKEDLILAESLLKIIERKYKINYDKSAKNFNHS